MKRGLLFAVCFLLSLHLALGASVHGTVYDYSLDPALNAIVEVNSRPQQTMVARNGTYGFELGNGDYLLTATYRDGSRLYSTEESVVIAEEGDYVIDLILFPDLREEEELANEDIPLAEIQFEEGFDWKLALIPLAVGLFILLIGYWYLRRKPKKDLMPDDKQEIYSYIRKRKKVTQKELSQEFAHSVAKISLILTELEAEGRIQKVKKGKGNVILVR